MADCDTLHRADHLYRLQAGCLSADASVAADQITRNGLWEYVVSHACIERTGGLLRGAIREHHLDVPESAEMQLDAFHDHVAAANAYSIDRISPILRDLSTERAPFLLLKGAALNATVYPTPGLRSMVDVDVLIQPQDAGRVDRLLLRAGCSRGPDLVRIDFYPRYHYEREYITPDAPGVKIDLHVRPFRPMRYSRTVPTDALWDDPMTASFGPLPVRIPNPENMLIHLCTHAACHGLGELRWLFDVKTWLEHYGPSIDFDRVADKCRQWRLSLPVQRALEKALTTFGGPNPTLVKAIHAVAAPAGLADRLTLWQAPRDEAHPIAHILVNFSCTPGWRHRFGYLLAVLIPGESHLAQLYERRHPGWRMIAHLVRACRALTKPFAPVPSTE